MHGGGRGGRRDRLDDLPLRDDLRGPHAVRRAAARRAGAAEHQRELLPAAGAGGRRDRARRSPAELRDLNRYPDRDAVALRADLAAYLGHGLDRRPTCGRPTAPTRSSSSCCRPSAARAGPRSASPRRTRCTRCSPLGTGTAWVDGRRDADFGLTAERRRGAGPRAPAGRGLPLLAEQPDRHRAATRRCVDAVLDEAPGMVVVDEAYAEFARPGTPQRADAAARPPAAGGDPDHEQGVRRSPAAGSATWPPTRPWSTRCSWSGCRTTSRR